MKSVEEQFISLKIKLISLYPSLGKLTTRIKLIEDNNVDVAATDGLTIYYNKQNMQGLNRDEIGFIYLHELLHIILNHMTMRGNRDAWLYNVATDYVINGLIIDKLLDVKFINTDNVSLNYLYDSKYRGMTSFEIYDELFQSKRIEEGIYLDLYDENQERNLDPRKAHEKWAEVENDVEAIVTINNILKSIGSDFGGLSIEPNFTEIKRDWRSILRDYLTKSKHDYCWTKPNKYFKHITKFSLPVSIEIEDGLEDIWCFIDTSGSMSSDDIDDLFSCIASMQQSLGKFTGRIISFDTSIHTVDLVTELDDIANSKIELEGRGGTDFQAVFDYISREDEAPRLVLICTDGYSSKPNRYEVNNKVIWLFTEGSSEDCVEDGDIIIDM